MEGGKNAQEENMSKTRRTCGKAAISELTGLTPARFAIISANNDENIATGGFCIKKDKDSSLPEPMVRCASSVSWDLKKELIKDKIADEFNVSFSGPKTHVGCCISIGVYRAGKYLCDAFFTRVDTSLASVLPFSESNLRSVVAKISSLACKYGDDKESFVREYKTYLDEPKSKRRAH